MQKRLRVFAGPNGSGKSSIIELILNKELEDGRKIDFGTYINADDLARSISSDFVDISKFGIDLNEDEFLAGANNSGLVQADFTLSRLASCLIWKFNSLGVDHARASEVDDNPYERIAQILAHVLREKLIVSGKKISFETVFSHQGKIEFIKNANSLGYKVYLYFVSTESPEINTYRVKKVRVAKSGHDVPEQKIIDRYYRSMNQLYDAAQLCYQCYFFDNSIENRNHNLFAQFKLDSDGNKIWHTQDEEFIPEWFLKYYSQKAGQA